MRKLIIRFRNEEDLKEFSNKIGATLSQNTKEYNYVTKETKEKKPVKAKGGHKKLDEYMKQWIGMPEFETNFKISEYAKIDFLVNEKEDNEFLSKLLEQNITLKTKSIWFPKLIQGEHRNLRVLGGRNAKYPIYVVTKGRSEEYRFSTSNWLTRMQQPHYLVVEGKELEAYQNSKLNLSVYCNLLVLDKKYQEEYDVINPDLGQKGTTGPGPARNFAADHAKANGFDWCWILDDNIENFDRYWRGRRILAHTPEVFRSLEDFVERYDNIGIAGLNYSKFCVGENVYPPYTRNTRIYSFGLWNLNCPLIKQRGRYNEDTIQSLDIMKANWCTVQWNCYLGAKVTTQKRPGGNTAEFYEKEGTKAKSQLLVEAHPDVSELVWKFNRWHHQVDYSGYKQELHKKENYSEIVDRQMKEQQETPTYIVRIDRDLCLGEKDDRYNLEEIYPMGCEDDVTNSTLYL